MVHADGATRLLDGARATPLGLSFDPSRPEHRETLPPRSTLLLYTDGLVERRREALDAGIARAADLVQENRDTGLDDLAREVMSRLAPSSGYQDDVALLLYRQPAPLEIEFPAEASYLAPTRAALRGWLTRAGVDPDQTLKVLIAAGEKEPRQARESAAMLAGLMPNAHAGLAPKSPHEWPMNRPELFNRTLQEWLQDQAVLPRTLLPA